VIVVADAKVALLEDAEPGIELQNTRLTVAEKMSLERKPRLTSCLHQFLNDLVEFGGEGADDPCHHDVVQPSPIGGWIGDVGEDVVIEGISTKREKHEVALPLVVGRRGFQNDRDHRLYVLDVDSLCMQVRDEGGVGVGAGVDGAIVIVILGDHNPLGSGELLFQVTSDGLLLLPSEGHSSDESFLLLVRGSGGGFSRGRGVVLLPLSGGGRGRGRDSLLLIGGEVGGAARHGR
jgi:hypothetical protein